MQRNVGFASRYFGIATVALVLGLAGTGSGQPITEDVKLLASDGTAGDRFGLNVPIDGDYMVVSASLDADNGTNSGSVYVFHWDGTQWVEQVKLTPADAAAHDNFGNCVDISGNRIAVAATHDDDKGPSSGSVYVFHWDGNQWVEEAKLTASDGVGGDAFGSHVSIDGDRIAVGATKDDDRGTDSGSVYVFSWDGTQWVEEAKLLASDGAASDIFGLGVSLHGDQVVVGASNDDDQGTDSGSIYVFELPGPVEVSAPQVTATHNQALAIPIAIDAIDGIVSAEVFLEYDTSLLTLVGVDTGGTLSDGWSVETNTEAGVGSLELLKIAMATDANAATGGGTLVEVDFMVKDVRVPMSSPLTLTHVLLNDGTPEHATTDGSVTLVGVDGSISSVPEEIIPRWSIEVTVADVDEDRDGLNADSVGVAVTNGSQTELLTVFETGASTGVFAGTIETVFSLSFSSDDGIVQAKAGDQIVFSYADSLDVDGVTGERTDATDVIGGRDGEMRTTVVSQPGDTVRVRVSDADLSDVVTVDATNPRTGESESILLSQFSGGSSVFYGRFFTATTSGVGDSALAVQKGDVLSVAYADTLTTNGGTASVVDDDEVVDPFGDAHANGSVQAFDAAQVLIHRLSTYGGEAGTLSGLDSLSANVDQGAPLGIIDGYDASLILRKVVGLVSRFEVQVPDAVNHPQPETTARPKRVPEERWLSLRVAEDHLSVWADSMCEWESWKSIRRLCRRSSGCTPTRQIRSIRRR